MGSQANEQILTSALYIILLIHDDTVRSFPVPIPSSEILYSKFRLQYSTSSMS